jgi:hypothetical protein
MLHADTLKALSARRTVGSAPITMTMTMMMMMMFLCDTIEVGIVGRPLHLIVHDAARRLGQTRAVHCRRRHHDRRG